jgi:hypothetical protein
VHHHKSSTVHTAIHTDYADCLLVCCQHNLYDIYLLLCVQCNSPDDGQRNCPKHVELYSKNKFEKLVQLIGCIIRIYHDARSFECQKSVCLLKRYNESLLYLKWVIMLACMLVHEVASCILILYTKLLCFGRHNKTMDTIRI